MLSEQEVDAYHRDGYVIPSQFRLADDECARLRSGLETVIATNPGVPPDRLVNTHLDGKPPYGLHGAEVFSQLAKDERILDMVEQVLGEDLILWLTHLFCKPASTGREVPWHQDGQYWPIRPHATCTVWVALDRVDRGNGALRVIPGSHKTGIVNHDVDLSPKLGLNQVARREEFDAQAAQYLELETGQVSLHHVDLLHGSARNTSGRRRAGLAMRYMPADAHFRRDIPVRSSKLDWTMLPLQLVRGVNRHPGNDLSVGHGVFDEAASTATF
ncbi:MAG: phytanoyl-CoA dioxygenase family protein [Pseudomonadota bacterium]